MRRVPLFHSVWFALLSPLILFAVNYEANSVTASNAGDYFASLYFGLYGIYCLQNFIACGEYHCLITGPGFMLAALLMVLRDVEVFDHGVGPPYIVFALAALLGHALEWQYSRRTGSHFLRR